MLTFLLFLFHDLNYFRTILLGCSAADVLELVDVEMLQQLMAVGGNRAQQCKE